MGNTAFQNWVDERLEAYKQGGITAKIERTELGYKVYNQHSIIDVQWEEALFNAVQHAFNDCIDVVVYSINPNNINVENYYIEFTRQNRQFVYELRILDGQLPHD